MTQLKTCSNCKYAHKLNFRSPCKTAWCPISGLRVKKKTLGIQIKKCYEAPK